MRLLLLVLAVVLPLSASEPPTRAEVAALAAKAQAWCLGQQQENGAFIPGDTFALGVTALTALALRDEPGLPADHPAIRRAVAFVASHRQSDGGFYDPKEGLANYGTSLALQLFLVADGVDPALIAGARDWLMSHQNRDAGALGEGGMGYGDKGAGTEDQSNTGYAVQGLRAAGVPASDPHLQKALAFLERCQDLSKVNPAPWVRENSGGGVYGPKDAHGSWERRDAGADPEKFTATGTMTYSLLSSYLALDLPPEDERVRAALEYTKRNYRFDANPGMVAGKEQQGLLYYHALMGRTFALLKLTTITLPDGRNVDWRADLFASIRARATPVTLADGGAGALWINAAPRWGEGVPHLSTAYMLRGLKAIHGTLER